MSVSDPLIKELKGYTLRLIQEAEKNMEITDETNDLMPFCQTLEKIFQKGCTNESWNWLEALGQEMGNGRFEKSFSYIRAVETVQNCQKIKTPIGKLRLLIRCCLVNKCLQIPVQIMVRSLGDRRWHWYYVTRSILGDEILGEIFLSVILQCSTLRFKLNINNAKFLDNTLLLPLSVDIEFVPCDSLGVAVSFVDDKAIVVHVDGDSIAAEDDQIQVGDVLDEINGKVLSNEMKGKLNNLMAKGRNKPVKIKVIKLNLGKDGDAYPPLVAILKKTNIIVDDLKGINEKMVKKMDGTPNGFRGGYIVRYVGSLEIGAEGDVKQIDLAVSSIIQKQESTDFVQVCLDCQELGLKVVEEKSSKLLFSHHFMEISSCGQTKRHPNYFAYIVGNDICNVATQFSCHVFHSESDEDIHTVLQSIGQGFQRTHYAV